MQATTNTNEPRGNYCDKSLGLAIGIFKRKVLRGGGTCLISNVFFTPNSQKSSLINLKTPFRAVTLFVVKFTTKKCPNAKRQRDILARIKQASKQARHHTRHMTADRDRRQQKQRPEIDKGRQRHTVLAVSATTHYRLQGVLTTECCM